MNAALSGSERLARPTTLVYVTELIILVLVVATALAFDFTNGFHDTGNAMATSIATGALKPKVAVALSAVLNLVGAFLSLAVAAAIAKDLVDQGAITLPLIFCGLIGGITWNLLTWLLGLPSSSSHALIGGIVGAMIAGVGTSGVLWTGLASKVVIPAAWVIAGGRCSPARHEADAAGGPPSGPRRLGTTLERRCSGAVRGSRCAPRSASEIGSADQIRTQGRGVGDRRRRPRRRRAVPTPRLPLSGCTSTAR